MAEEFKPSQRLLREALLHSSSEREFNHEFEVDRRSVQRLRQFSFLRNLVIALGLTAAAAFYFTEYKPGMFPERIRELLVPMALLFGLAGMVAIKYLDSTPEDPLRSISDAESRRLRLYIERRFRDIQSQIQTPRALAELSESDKQKVLQQLLSKFESEALNDYLSALKDSINRQIRAHSLEDRYQLTRSRLAQETKDLSKRGNFNLVIGALVALAGLIVLGYTVANTPTSPEATVLLSYYVPRTTLVVLIEVFAYFFLSLYRGSLMEIKYFQNELTNIESKHLAWELAQKCEDTQVKVRVVDQLANTERNPPLQVSKQPDSTGSGASTITALTDTVRELSKKIEGSERKGA